MSCGGADLALTWRKRFTGCWDLQVPLKGFRTLLASCAVSWVPWVTVTVRQHIETAILVHFYFQICWIYFTHPCEKYVPHEPNQKKKNWIIIWWPLRPKKIKGDESGLLLLQSLTDSTYSSVGRRNVCGSDEDNSFTWSFRWKQQQQYKREKKRIVWTWWDRFYKPLFFHMVVNKSHQPSSPLSQLLTAPLLHQHNTNNEMKKKEGGFKIFLIVCKCIWTLKLSHWITGQFISLLKCCCIKLAFDDYFPLLVVVKAQCFFFLLLFQTAPNKLMLRE